MAEPLNDEWDELFEGVARGDIRFSTATLLNIVRHLRRNFTHDTQTNDHQDAEALLLGYESTYNVSERVNVNEADQLDTPMEEAQTIPLEFHTYAGVGRYSQRQLKIKILKKAGRATIYRERLNYFLPVNPNVTDAEKAGRSLRSKEANLRSATRRAADEALENDCTMWVTLTFDDAHRSDGPAGEYRAALRRLSERYKRKTGKPLKHVAVVGTSPAGREHVHALLSGDVDPQDISEVWHNGHDLKIKEIDSDEIEEKVGYMAKHIRQGRVTLARFIRSRTARGEEIQIPIKDIDEGRQVLMDEIHPHKPRLVRSNLFGAVTNIAYRFPPIRDDE
jgi:hypothetical protein